MKLLIVVVNKQTKDPLVTEAESYLKKIALPFRADTINVSIKKNLSESKKELKKSLEGKEILKASNGYFRIALTEWGKNFSSHSFAQFLEKKSLNCSKIAFLIGGAFGLSREVLTESDMTLSLSPLTMPHRMAYLVLLEQIYRACEILRNSPYHK